MPIPDHEALAATLESTGRYRVLRRLEPRTTWHEPDGSELRTAVVVDVETTGLDSGRDAVIQFCGIPFTYDPTTGRVFAVGQPLTGYDDPGRSIPPFVTRLTGITDADVAGQHLDEGAIGALVAGAGLVITHNAAFDRPFLESRLPALFRDKPFACSIEGIPWDRYGFPSRRLEYLLYQRHRLFFDAHSAEADCQALLHALAEPFEDGVLPMALLLEGARRKTLRIWAVGAAYEQKDTLKDADTGSMVGVMADPRPGTGMSSRARRVKPSSPGCASQSTPEAVAGRSRSSMPGPGTAGGGEGRWMGRWQAATEGGNSVRELTTGAVASSRLLQPSPPPVSNTADAMTWEMT